MTADIERKPVFSLAEGDDGSTIVMVGMPKTAFDDMMRDGTSCDFDFRKAGVPFVLTIFTGADHSDCMQQIVDISAQLGVPIQDERRKDFSIPEPSKC